MTPWIVKYFQCYLVGEFLFESPTHGKTRLTMTFSKYRLYTPKALYPIFDFNQTVFIYWHLNKKFYQHIFASLFFVDLCFYSVLLHLKICTLLHCMKHLITFCEEIICFWCEDVILKYLLLLIQIKWKYLHWKTTSNNLLSEKTCFATFKPLQRISKKYLLMLSFAKADKMMKY